MSKRRQVDLVAAAGTAIILIMTVIYIWVMRQQGDRPLVWVLTVLLGGACLSGYGAMNNSQHRRAALLIAGVLLTILGILAILSIGYPILAAGILCLIAGARAKR